MYRDVGATFFNLKRMLTYADVCRRMQEVGVYRDVGATFFNLNELHSHLKHPSIPTVIEVDLYHTAALLPLVDDVR